MIESKLSEPVQDFMSIITDMSGIHGYMSNLSLDWRRMPLGKLSKSQISEGYKILVKIEKVMKILRKIAENS